MKNLIPLLLLVFLIVSCQNEKTAFVDNNKIVENFDAMQEREAFYKKAEDSLKVRIEVMVAQSGYQDMVTQYQTQAEQMSESEKKELYDKIMQLQQSIGQQQQMASQGLQQRKGKELDSMVNIVKTFIKDYGKSNGYSYIFGSNDAGNILYGSEQKDLSDEIIAELNSKYPVEEEVIQEDSETTEEVE
jgi:outer membrane protein